MKKIRKGNDITVNWSLYTPEAEPYNLEGLDLHLYVGTAMRKEESEHFVVHGHTITWGFAGKDQKHAGVYTLTLVVNEGEAGMITVDTCNIFELVTCSCKAGGNDPANVVIETLAVESIVNTDGVAGLDVVEKLIAPVKEDVAALSKSLSELSESNGNKVDKEEGKGLSTNDFTDKQKQKLESLENYNDSTLRNSISALSRSILQLDEQKQDTITDLKQIRDGASKGATALQSIPDEYVTEDELSKKGFLTEHQDISHLATKTEVGDAIKGVQDEINGLDISADYESDMEETMAMPNAVGGFSKGTTVADLQGKSLSQMFDILLFPAVDPSHGTPSVTGFALSSSTSPVELGASVPSVSDASFNRATWTNYNNSLPYAGEATSTVYDITINGQSYSDKSALPSTFTALGNQTYKATINYAKGPTPVNNRGEERPSLACAAGSVSATRTVNVTVPWFASTAAATSSNPVVKQSLISWSTSSMDTSSFTVQPSGTVPQCFKLPRQIKTLQSYDTSTGQWGTEKLSLFTETTEVISINGINHTYYVYTYNGSPRGETILKATF